MQGENRAGGFFPFQEIINCLQVVCMLLHLIRNSYFFEKGPSWIHSFGLVDHIVKWGNLRL